MEHCHADAWNDWAYCYAGRCFRYDCSKPLACCFTSCVCRDCGLRRCRAIQSTVAFQMLNVNSCIVMDIYKDLCKKEKRLIPQLKQPIQSLWLLWIAITVGFAIKPPALIGVINNLCHCRRRLRIFHAYAFWRMVEAGKQIWLYCFHGCRNWLLFVIDSGAALSFGVLPLIPSLVIAP